MTMVISNRMVKAVSKEGFYSKICWCSKLALHNWIIGWNGATNICCNLYSKNFQGFVMSYPSSSMDRPFFHTSIVESLLSPVVNEFLEEM
ncbi:SNARE associated Golgi protein family [Trifolium repens]|nr:SNARE associated Golgi protein family [Trifolium repens]